MTGIGCSRCRPATRARIAGTLAREGSPVIHARKLNRSPEEIARAGCMVGQGPVHVVCALFPEAAQMANY